MQAHSFCRRRRDEATGSHQQALTNLLWVLFLFFWQNICLHYRGKCQNNKKLLKKGTIQYIQLELRTAFCKQSYSMSHFVVMCMLYLPGIKKCQEQNSSIHLSRFGTKSWIFLKMILYWYKKKYLNL